MKLPEPVFKKNFIELHFFDDIYRIYVVVLICPYSQLQEWLTAHDYKDKDTLRPSNGYYLQLTGDNSTKGNYFELLWLSKRDGACLAHELFHLVTYCLIEDKGLALGRDSNEAFAYYIESWFKRITTAWKPTITKIEK